MLSAWKRLIPIAVVILVPGTLPAWGQTAGDTLKSGFENPPASARPRVWWHWMNGNITKEGIKLDLEWMKRVGLGGFQNFDAALDDAAGGGEPAGLHDAGMEGRVQIRDRRWPISWDMEEAIAGSPGWSESGGPWVPASQGMKKYVWSETDVEGGKPFTGMLAHPPIEYRSISEPGYSRCSCTRREVLQAHPAVLCRCGGRRLSQRAGDVSLRIAAPEDDVERRIARFRDADRRRSGEDDQFRFPSGRRELLDPVRISAAADDSRDHVCDSRILSWIEALAGGNRRSGEDISKRATTGRTFRVGRQTPAAVECARSTRFRSRR